MLSFNIIDILILNKVQPSIFNKVAHQTWHECFVLINWIVQIPTARLAALLSVVILN